MADDNELEVREVVAADPSLTPEANRLLTQELRDAVGADRVRVPRDTPHVQHERQGGRGGLRTAAIENRLLLVITFLAMVVTGAIVSLTTGSWWAVVIAAAVHAVGSFTVLTMFASAAVQVERVSPDVAARLTEEGVPDPDAALSRLVEEYAGGDGQVSAADLVATGRNEQPADPHTAPAAASAQQRTAMTPAGGPTAPAGTDSAPDRVLVKGIVAMLMILAVIAGALAVWLGPRMLIIPAIMLPIGLLWLILQTRMGGRREEAAGQAGETSSTAPRTRARVLASVAFTVVGVVGFVALMGWAAGFF